MDLIVEVCVFRLGLSGGMVGGAQPIENVKRLLNSMSRLFPRTPPQTTNTQIGSGKMPEPYMHTYPLAQPTSSDPPPSAGAGRVVASTMGICATSPRVDTAMHVPWTRLVVPLFWDLALAPFNGDVQISNGQL